MFIIAQVELTIFFCGEGLCGRRKGLVKLGERWVSIAGCEPNGSKCELCSLQSYVKFAVSTFTPPTN